MAQHISFFLGGTDGTDAIDLGGAGAMTINIGILTSAAVLTYDTALYSDVSAHAVATGTGWSGPTALTGLTASNNGSGKIIYDADDLVIPQDLSGFTNGLNIVAYAAVSGKLIRSYTHSQALQITTGPLTISFGADGYAGLDFSGT